VLQFIRDLVGRRRNLRIYDRWFRAKVREALDDPSATVPHDMVVKDMRAIIDGTAAAKMTRTAR
jgi:hypothetical protein